MGTPGRRAGTAISPIQIVTTPVARPDGDGSRGRVRPTGRTAGRTVAGPTGMGSTTGPAVPLCADGREPPPGASPGRTVPPVAERRRWCSRPTATSGSTTGTGCGTRTIPAVIAHLEAENAYTEAVMAGTVALQEALFDEMVARIEETDLSVPVRKGPWRYYSRTVEGSSYGIHCRRPADGSRRRPAEQVLLDENVLAEGTTTSPSATFSVSPDHRWLAYSTDTTGGERYTMRFRGPGHRGRVGRVASRTPPTGWPGPTTTPPSSTSGSTRPCGPTSCGATGSAPTRRRRPGVRGARRPLLPRRGPDQGRPVRPVRPRLEGDLRGPGARRRRPDGRVHGDRAPAPGDRVQRRPRPRATPGRAAAPVPHRHQRRGRGLPADGGPRGPAGPGRLDRGDPAPGPGSGSTTSTRSPATWRSTNGQDGETRIRVVDARHRRTPPRSSQPESPSTVWGEANPEYDSTVAPLRLHLAGHARGRSTTSTWTPARPSCASASRCSGDFDPPATGPTGCGPTADDGTQVPISVVYRPDLVADAGPARAGRRGTLPPLRLRLLRGLDGPDLLVAPAQPARPGLRLRHRPRPGRRRDGPALVRGGQAGGQAQHLHRLRGLRPPPGRRRVDLARPAGRPGAAAPAGC